MIPSHTETQCSHGIHLVLALNVSTLCVWAFSSEPAEPGFVHQVAKELSLT